jgi:hypothetical protein
MTLLDYQSQITQDSASVPFGDRHSNVGLKKDKAARITAAIVSAYESADNPASRLCRTAVDAGVQQFCGISYASLPKRWTRSILRTSWCDDHHDGTKLGYYTPLPSAH